MSDKVEKTKKGFAAMDPALRQELASRGGKSVHAMGKAHQYTKEEARAAGLKGAEIAKARAAFLICALKDEPMVTFGHVIDDAVLSLRRDNLIEQTGRRWTLTEMGRTKAAILVEKQKALAASKRP